MKTYKVIKFNAEHYTIWNNFVGKAKNATFLFHRNFLEYHQDRFEDFSLLIFDEKDNLKAIFPANVSNQVVYSHQGLTYGGLVVDDKLKTDKFLLIFKEILSFLNQNNINCIEIKQIPGFYNPIPSEEINYALFLLKAKLFRTDLLSVINLENKFKIENNRLEGVKKAKNLNLEIIETNNFDLFWNQVLIPNLLEKHQAKPVHTLNEIKNLALKFPENIKQFNVYQNQEILAGTTLFIHKNVVHVQYISAIGNKSLHGALDFLFEYLITSLYKNFDFFDFGTSNENQGKNINAGLLFWKESFGARTIVQNFYEIETKNYNILNDVLI